MSGQIKYSPEIIKDGLSLVRLIPIILVFILILSGCDTADMAVTNINQVSYPKQSTVNQNINQEAVLGEKIKNTEADAPVVPETVASDTIDATPAPTPASAPTPAPAPIVVPTPALVPVVIPDHASAPVVVPPSAPIVVPASVPEPVAVVPPPAPKPAPAPVSNCDPNYSPCVPIASDVDCAGGSGNGPAYVEGPVTVIGNDIYRLDSDHDGLGCE